MANARRMEMRSFMGWTVPENLDSGKRAGGFSPEMGIERNREWTPIDTNSGGCDPRIGADVHRD
jgi:hypothetical protein